VYCIYSMTLELGSSQVNHPEKSKSFKDSVLTTLIDQIILLLIQQTHMKEKHKNMKGVRSL